MAESAVETDVKSQQQTADNADGEGVGGVHAQTAEFTEVGETPSRWKGRKHRYIAGYRSAGNCGAGPDKNPDPAAFAIESRFRSQAE